MKAAKVGSLKLETPETGVLKAVGYHVGLFGFRQNGRRELLDQIMFETLPFVGSPGLNGSNHYHGYDTGNCIGF